MDTQALLSVEQQFLGALIERNSAYAKISSKITASDFLDPVHADIFSVAEKLIQAGSTANGVTIGAHIDQSPETQAYLRKIEFGLVSFVDFRAHSDIIARESTRRKIKQAVDEAMKSIDDDEQENDAIGGNLISSVTGALTKNNTLEDFVDIAQTLEISGENSNARYFSTGIKRLDDGMQGGVFTSKLYGFAARPKMGKSTMLLTLAYNLAEAGARVAYYTLEMDKKELSTRILCRKADVYTTAIGRRLAPPPAIAAKINDAKANLGELKNLKISSIPRMSIKKMVAELNAVGYAKSADVVIVDYLQIITGKTDRTSGAEHYDTVAQTMAEIAKTHDIAILTAVQQNREGQIRGGDGVVVACDILYEVKSELMGDGSRLGWLEMLATRYTAWLDVGSKESPSILLNEHGPYFEET